MTIQHETGAVIDVLRRSTLFRDWSPEALRDVAASLQPRAIPTGLPICREGDEGEEMYIVDSGRFSVETTVGNMQAHVADLGSGAVIGEMAVLSGHRRTATVTAVTDGRIWVLARSDFQRILRARPEMGVAVARLMSARMTDMERLHMQYEKHALFSLSEGPDVVTIGRDKTNDIVLSDPQVSAVHAVIQRTGSSYEVIDLNSESGTYLNGRRVQAGALQDGDTIWIGRNPVLFDRSALMSFSRGGGVKLDAVDLVQEVKQGRTILQGVSLSIYPGELVAIVGASGAGKTTLLNALNGFKPASSGRVTFNGVDYYQHLDLFRTALGYVPQDDIVHEELTIEETLHYAARLRLPRDTSRDEITARIDDVLQELELIEHRHTAVRRLSGGQRKRVSIAVELLTRPGIFFLDEPTSGLDPALDGRMMALFRKLANQDRTLLMTTHATKHIMMCDKVVFLARGGYLAFFGAPAEAVRYFEVDDVVDIYDRLELEEEHSEWARKFAASEFFRKNVQERLEGGNARTAAGDDVPSRVPRRGLDSVRQLFWLSARYLHVLRHDPAVLALFLLQAPIIAGTVAITFPHAVFAMSARTGGEAREAVVLLFNLAVASVWLGANNAASSITDEKAIYLRERLINLRVMPYILSKIWILGLFSLVQSALLIAITAMTFSLPGGPSVLVSLYFIVLLTNIVGLALGLLASSVAQNSLQATALVVTLVIPQLILSGASVPIRDVTFVGKIVALLMLSRWSLSLLGFAVGLNDRLNAQLIPGTTNHFAEQFSINPWGYALILVAFFVAFLGGAIFIQSRKGAR